MAIIDNMGGMGASAKEQLQTIYDRVVNNKHIYKILKTETDYNNTTSNYSLDIKNYISNYTELDSTDFRIIYNRLRHVTSSNTGQSFDIDTSVVYDPATGFLSSIKPLAFKATQNTTYTFFDVCVITQKNVEFIE